MVKTLVILTGARDAKDLRLFQYFRADMTYDRAKQLLRAMDQVRALQNGSWDNLSKIVLVDYGSVQFVADPRVQDCDDLLASLAGPVNDGHKTYLVRSGFPYPTSRIVDSIAAKIIVGSDDFYWSTAIDDLEHQSFPISRRSLLRALCILAPADHAASYFRQLIEIDPAGAAKYLNKGGFSLDEPNGNVVRSIPFLPLNDMIHLLSHQDQQVRDTALAALEYIETGPCSRSHTP